MAVGERMGLEVLAGQVIGLSGDLGAGKTTFTRGFLRGAGGDQADVTSPTFTLLHRYRARVPVYHLDLYRLEGARAAEEAGLQEFMGGDGVALVEWFENAVAFLPDDRVEVRLEVLGESRRKITIKGMEWR